MTTDGKPLDFTRFKSVGGVMYPSNAEVAPGFLCKRGSAGDPDSAEEQAVQHCVQELAKSRNRTGRKWKQWRQNTRRNFRATGYLPI